MTTLITGGGGYIGVPLAEELLNRGEDVRLFDRFYFGRQCLAPIAEHPKLTQVRGDIRTVEPAVFEGVDTVIDLAGLSNDPSCDLDPSLTSEINLDGALRVARLAREAKVRRLVYSSSCSVYGEGEGILTEESPRRPVSLYAKAKIDAEDALLKMADDDFCMTILRNATVYGLAPRMRFDLVVNLMTLYAFQNGKIFVLGGGKQWRPLVHVRDVGRAMVIVADADTKTVNGQVYNVGSDHQNYQVASVAALVSRGIPNTKVERVPDDPDKRTYRVSFAKFHDALGFEPAYEVEDGVKEIYEALQAGRIDDGIRTKTVAFYKFLLDAEKLVEELSIDGRIL